MTFRKGERPPYYRIMADCLCLLAAMTLLGRGDLAVGYPLLLVAICLTGLVQVVLARLKAARFSALFPSSVVEGMLASIGGMLLRWRSHRFEQKEKDG